MWPSQNIWTSKLYNCEFVTDIREHAEKASTYIKIYGELQLHWANFQPANIGSKAFLRFNSYLLFRWSHFWFFGFWSLLVTKLRKYYVIFVYILQGKMGKMNGKKRKENHATKVTKIPKTKRQKYVMNETYINQKSYSLICCL